MEYEIFKKFPSFKYGFSDRTDGAMPLSSDINPSAENLENRARYLKNNRVPASKIVIASREHGNHASIVTSKNFGQAIPASDALASSEANIYLIVTAADCFPIYLFDPVKKVIGLAHAGWRGIVRGIVQNTILRMRELGSSPENILAAIGPGIQQHHFEIKKDALENFLGYENFVFEKPGQWFVDLPGIISHNLTASGLFSENVEQTWACTYCLDRGYFSFRRDKPKKVQAMLAFAGRVG